MRLGTFRTFLLNRRGHYFLIASFSNNNPLRQFSSTPALNMRAAVVRDFGGHQNIVAEDGFEVPTVGEGQVLVRVKAAGVNPVDTYIREGKYAKLPQLPYVVGREGAGVVEEVGPNVTTFQPGDRVWFAALENGATAELAVVSADNLFKLPERVSFTQGATLGIAYFTAYRALFMKAHAQAGQSLLVHGASGGVGLAACQIAKAHGLRVYGTASSPEGEALAKQHGCEVVWNHQEPDYIQKIQQQFPNGFDVIMEMLANVNLCSDLSLVAVHGKVVIVGSRGPIQIDPRACMQKESEVIGVMSSLTTPQDYQRMGERLVGLLAGGHITPYVGRKFPLEHTSEAQRLVLEPGARGKIVVCVVPEEEEEAPAVNPTPSEDPTPAAEPPAADDIQVA